VEQPSGETGIQGPKPQNLLKETCLLGDLNVRDITLGCIIKAESVHYGNIILSNKTKRNSVALVRKRTIPTERPPLVVVVSANFRG
jgi:hypothetical protein